MLKHRGVEDAANSTWTPTVCNIMAFWTVFRGFALLSCILGGCRYRHLDKHGTEAKKIQTTSDVAFKESTGLAAIICHAVVFDFWNLCCSAIRSVPRYTRVYIRCIYIYIYVYTEIYLNTCVYIYACKDISYVISFMYIYTYIHIHAVSYACEICICTSVHIYLCIYIWVTALWGPVIFSPQEPWHAYEFRVKGFDCFGLGLRVKP